jgi:hypothetical protein
MSSTAQNELIAAAERARRERDKKESGLNTKTVMLMTMGLLGVGLLNAIFAGSAESEPSEGGPGGIAALFGLAAGAALIAVAVNRPHPSGPAPT